MNTCRYRIAGAILPSMLAFAPMANAADCPNGDTRQVHNVGNFHFVTNSWVEHQGNLRRYVSCVGNLDQNTDLLVTWFVAGPSGTYVPSDQVSMTPRMSNDLDPRPVNGCIKYGNLGDRTPAQFMGSKADEDANTKGNYCQTGSEDAKQSVAENGIPADGWRDQVRVFFPSNPENPHDTMLEVTGVIGIEPKGDSFESFFSYQANQYKGRTEGNPEGISVRPVFPYAGDFFIKAFSENNNPFKAMGREGDIRWMVKDPKPSWAPVPAYYEFVDRENRVLGSIPMPLFGPN
jgi:hypothetical protein